MDDRVQHLTIESVGGNTITFTGGGGYTFKDPDLFARALLVKGFQPQPGAKQPINPLAEAGNSVISLVCWNECASASTQLVHKDRFLEHGMGLDNYKAWICVESHLAFFLQVPEQPKPGFWKSWDANDVLARATETLIGAVWLDSGMDIVACSKFMRNMGIYWPANETQEQTMTEYLSELEELGVVGKEVNWDRRWINRLDTEGLSKYVGTGEVKEPAQEDSEDEEYWSEDLEDAEYWSEDFEDQEYWSEDLEDQEYWSEA